MPGNDHDEIELAVSAQNVGLVYETEPLSPEKGFKGVVLKDLEIPGSGVTAIMGGSGSGKSTLLSLLSGLRQANTVSLDPGGSKIVLLPDTPKSASILAGETPTLGSIAYVFQEALLMKTLPVDLNVDMGRILCNPPLPKTELGKITADFKLADDIETLAHKRVKNLSGGQAQRISLARAVAVNPEIFFCDEPTSNLDKASGDAVMEYLADWAHEHERAVIWVTHNREQALKYADTFLYMSEGRIYGDGNQPLKIGHLPAEERGHALDALIATSASTPPISQQTLLDCNLHTDLQKDELNAANSVQKQYSKEKRGSFISLSIYLFKFVLYELFERIGREGKKKNFGRSLADRFWNGPLSFNKPGFALVMALGVITTYFAFLAVDVLNRSFEASLSRPEVAHFVLTTRGKQDGNTRELLSKDSLKELGKTLADRLAPVDRTDWPEPKIYGRRAVLFAPVSTAVDGTCEANTADTKVAPLLVFREKEPLFKQMPVKIGKQTQIIGDFSRKSLRNKVVVTNQFLKTYLPVAEGAKTPVGFCFGEFDREYVEILGVVKTFPGSGDLQFLFAMTNDSYIRMLQKNPPSSWTRDNGRTEQPPFGNAALYFDASYAERLFCTFSVCDGKENLANTAYVTNYKLNQDALDQVKKLIGFAVGAQAVLLGVIGALVIAVCISISLSVSEFIGANERFLCLMRAFGYRLRHVNVLFVFEFTLILLMGGFFALIAIAAFHFFLAVSLASAFALPVEWLEPSSFALLVSFVVTFVLTCLVGFLVLGRWWLSNRYVGGKLQSL